MTRIIPALSEISAQYDALFVDLWGCVHDGVTAYPEAIAALQAYRKSGGIVILVTNSPKPREGVAAQLGQFGVPADAYDSIASSGDSARSAMFRGMVGEKVYFMGEWTRDSGFFDPIEIINDPAHITRVPLQEAEGIVCCGPFDPMADPAVNRADFLYAKQKGMKLLCANPDIVVDRGEVREWCAGALAALYTEMGGESLYFGKPHPPIYDLARRRLNALANKVDSSRILAIGDGIHTDIQGAQGEDIDSLFITGGLAASETKTKDQPDADALEAFVTKQMITPTFAIGRLR
ncbi:MULTISPECIES: TIGR01459 family HAD-type hydrolase [Lentibacter]|jgi:HAD superfamily hydrolase (TIGR01459 family)|uniref:HAD-superfamily class IIA hydrolase, TIGR01459 n=1 Tax=Lentibacter algarum TaxID=576131 RepID=A0A1H3JQL0_9RHOB|nr:TIGR01459 family HAD-type hydrolase [Lentibacter algarum]MCO4777288.1 TIGR01459 family HAD-type hydrolase [Lentibacter algarum]MCO4828319.1 TIGR01459 family HAD-type hydrolase [Lentibacter algarum]WIF32362.1 putative hydrolase, HAD superfamily [Lentibacter algarum]SDY42222.1 HAD-superfamily class IIA hydrolase, TIGR01459 [Lentibacter algarum]